MIEALPIPDELPVTKATFFGLLSPQPMFLSRFSKESHVRGLKDQVIWGIGN